MTRREFLVRTSVGAGLTIAVVATPFGYRLLSAAEAAETEGSIFSPNIWLNVAGDGAVTVIVNKSEMGQGVYTSLPMIVAEELSADWKKVVMTEAPAADKYKDPVWGMQATGGSTSVRHMYEPLSLAGAAGREMLVAAAAKTWGVPEGECEAARSKVKHAKSGRTLTFGELALKAGAQPVPQKPKLKSRDQFDIVGEALDRLDVPEKVQGKARFGIDAMPKGRLYAAIARPPAFGAKPKSFDKKAALKIKGVKHVASLETGVAVCATSLDGAWKGRDALKVQWSEGTRPKMDNESLKKDFHEHMKKSGVSALDKGDAKKALSAAKKRVEASYIVPYLCHVTMEPMNCTAAVSRDRCEIWVPTQNQSGVLKMAQKITGLKAEQIHVHTTFLGGGFGRRFELDMVEPTLKLAKETGKPIKWIYKREEDTRYDFYRPSSLCHITGGLDDSGTIAGWKHKIVCPSIWARVNPGRMEGGVDPSAVEGVVNTPYEIPDMQVEYVRIDLPIPVGFWRSVGNSINGFTMESFMDEMAHAAGKDPLEFRLNHLKNHPRPKKLLETVADKAGWGKSLPEGRAMGIAQHFSFNTYSTQVAEVSVDKSSGKVTVHRIISGVDCGRVVNPAIVQAQMRGGSLFGLSAALKEEVSFGKGGVESANFYNYPILRIEEAPHVETHIVVSGAELGGMGEPPVPPIAPAVANAVFAATGVRLRQLPMTPMNVQAAMKS
jgi:isoquinoline 1-oxidoreductase beta subunit